MFSDGVLLERKAMMAAKLPTEFAPAERATVEELRRQVGYFSSDTITRPLLDAVPTILSILNGQRQVVYANQALLDFIGAREDTLVHGLRPGEALGCLHAGKTPGGCGTSEACSTCGAVLAILASQAEKREVRECHVAREAGGKIEGIDLLVLATPFAFREEMFTVFALSDISHEKRRRALERLFFHDVLNLTGSIQGFVELLRDYDPDNRQEIFHLLHRAAGQIVEEIDAQRTLTVAESGELQVSPGMLKSRSFLEELVEIYRHHDCAKGCQLTLDVDLFDGVFASDPALLRRVLGNMLKNALEASDSGEMVTVGCTSGQGMIEFWVHNPAVMDRRTQLRIFNRSFSTKGTGRGLGTYGMRLLSEYLHGSVTFSSNEGEGTTFQARFPINPFE